MRKTAAALLGFLLSISSFPTIALSQGYPAAPAYRTSVSAQDYGPLPCDGVTDVTATINLAMSKVPTGATVTLPACGGSIPPAGGGSGAENGIGYVVKSHLFVQAVHLIGLGQGATLKCELSSADVCIYATDTGINDLRNATTSVEHLALFNSGSGSGAGGLTAEGGNNLLADDVVISGFPGDGFTGQCGYSNGWLETLSLNRVRVVSSGRDNFHFTVSNNANCFITQTKITNSTSRLPGRSAVYLESDGLVSNSKISVWDWDDGEIDCTNGSSTNCVDLVQNGGASQPMEFIGFHNTTIEDADGTGHSGYAVGATIGSGGGAIGMVQLTGVYYNEASGALQTANMNHWKIDACDDGNVQTCGAQDSIQIQGNRGLSWANQTLGTGTATLAIGTGNAPTGCTALKFVPISVNGTNGYALTC